jgi:hypothetical protein
MTPATGISSRVPQECVPAEGRYRAAPRSLAGRHRRRTAPPKGDAHHGQHADKIAGQQAQRADRRDADHGPGGGLSRDARPGVRG